MLQCSEFSRCRKCQHPTWVPVQVPAALLLLELILLGAGKDGPTALASAPKWETGLTLSAPGFGLVQAWLWRQFGK